MSPPWKKWALEADPGHPALIALRTYSLALALSLGPAVLPLVFAHRPARAFWRALSTELRPTGLATAITTAVAGGATLQRLWDSLQRRHARLHAFSPCQRAFLSNIASSTLAAILLRWRVRRRDRASSSSSDLSLLLLVRALDASVQALILRMANKRADTDSSDDQCKQRASRWQKSTATCLDALVFWVSSARIMWCFFYQPHRLPPSYLKWINSLANVDRRLLEVLRAVRQGSWSYIHGSPTKPDVVVGLAEELGRPPSWGNPSLLPAYGGRVADETWRQLGVSGRCGIGGLPCELVHGGIGATFGLHNSCVANALIRTMYGFAQALAIYLPVHFLPILLSNPRSIIRPHRVLPPLLSAIRSATFLACLLSSYWFAVCFTRTLVLARLFPRISHDVWDGPYGCTLAGSLVCGSSIWIENAKRRGEMALYVLPKALRASVPETWLRSNHRAVQFAECLTFILSLASLLTLSVHRPESLRGLSRWTLAFVMRGRNAKKRDSEIATFPPVDPTGLGSDNQIDRI